MRVRKWEGKVKTEGKRLGKSGKERTVGGRRRKWIKKGNGMEPNCRKGKGTEKN